MSTKWAWGRLVRSKQLRFGAALLVAGTGAVAGLLVVDRSADASYNRVEPTVIARSELTFISPNRGSTFVYRNGQGATWSGTSISNRDVTNENTGSGVKHILKNNRASRVEQIVLQAYHTNEQYAKQARFVFERDPRPRANEPENDDCEFDVNGARRLSITVNGTPLGNDPNNEIMPAGGWPANRANQDATCRELEYRTFRGNNDATQLPPNENGVRYWVNTIVIRLSGDRVSPPADQPDPKNGIRFQVRTIAVNDNDLNNTRRYRQMKIGHRAGTGATTYGTVESFNNRKPNSVVTGIRFGLPCDDTATTFGTVRLFDPDANGYGPSYVKVLKQSRSTMGDWTTLREDEYRAVDSFDQFMSSNRWRTTINNGTASLRFDYNANFNYMMIIDNPWSNSTYSPTGNVLGYQLPGDPINGETSCDSPTTDTYRLTPSANVNPGTAVRGEIVTSTSTVDKQGNADPGDHIWRIRRVTYAPGVTPRSAALPPTIDVCAEITNETQCVFTDGSPNFPSGSVSFTNDQDPITESYVIPSNAALGTTYCFITSIEQPTQASNPQWAHSSPDGACVVVGIRPTLQVWGHDARVMGMIDTSTSSVTSGASTVTLGSWGEYALLSNGVNFRMGSSAGLAGGATTDNQFDWSTLTFANLGRFGSYGGVAATVDAYEETRTENGPYTLTTATWNTLRAQNQNRPILRVNGTLRIVNNLAYNATYPSVSQLPRAIVIADDVIVDGNVSQIDAWIIAKNRLSTCAQARQGTNDFPSLDSDGLLDSSKCRSRLTFNAPVIANQLYAYRTAGDGEAPAEVFNLRADAFLSSLASGSTPTATTQQVTELPPRF